MKKRWSTSDEWMSGARAAVEAAALDASADTSAEQRITDWLSRLRNLHGVPFTSLIPDVRMLPQESIRIFRIDENWIDCLIDGAFSIGRSTTGNGDASREAAMFGRIRIPLRNRAATARPRRIFGGEHARANAEGSQTRSGFLLRSGVVSGWPSMEVRAFDADGRELEPVRLDRPAQDVLFAVFNGELAKLSFSEPAETLHFGFEPSANESFRKRLKWVTPQPGHPAGSMMDAPAVPVPMRDSARRVIDANALAKAIHQSLVNAGGMAAGAQYSGAELALELVQGVQQVDFPIEGAPR
jgi:hypothetical protein